jgi:hypothetical protein
MMVWKKGEPHPPGFIEFFSLFGWSPTHNGGFGQALARGEAEVTEQSSLAPE